jgi:hypothetical protein
VFCHRLEPSVPDLPWDDEKRWPALLRRIESVAGELLAEVEQERRLWRIHQQVLRADPDATSQADRNFLRVSRHLEHVIDAARLAREHPGRSNPAPLDMSEVHRHQQQQVIAAMLRVIEQDREDARRRREGLTISETITDDAEEGRE